VRYDEPSNSCRRGGDRANMVLYIGIARVRKQVDLSRATSGDDDAIPVLVVIGGHFLLPGYVNLGC